MSFAICHGNRGRDRYGDEIGPHCPLELIAGTRSDDGLEPVQAEQSHYGYELTNRYEDGVIGVDDDSAVEAECDESPTCSLCGCEIHHWDHSAVVA